MYKNFSYYYTQDTKGIKFLINFYNSRINNENNKDHENHNSSKLPQDSYKINIKTLIEKYNPLYSNDQAQIQEPYLNKKFYHITNYKALEGIKAEGFKLGQTGMFGGGIYFAEHKCSVSNDVLIVSLLKVGRCLTERWSHKDWNLQKVNEMGYDSVQMRHCRTGIEICLYEPSRVKILDVYIYNSEDDSMIRYSHEKDSTRIIEFQK